MAQTVKRLPTMQEMWVRSLGREDPLEKEVATHSSTLAWEIPWNLYAEYIMRNAGLDEPQAGIKIARRYISNLRYADDTSLMAENEEKLKSLLMKMNLHNTSCMAAVLFRS